LEQNRPLSVPEVAEILAISKNTVYDLIHKHELASYRIGRKVRVDLADIEAYKNKSRTDPSGRLVGTLHTPTPSHAVTTNSAAPSAPVSADMIILCGQDLLSDVLTQYLLRPPYNFRALRSYIGSFNGLLELYNGRATVSSVHLWDGVNDEYNLPYVRYLLPGISCRLVNLAYRTQGFYVAKGNPKQILTWEDLTRPDVLMFNREIGSGVRVLIDESLKKLGISPKNIRGYERCEKSHMAVASVVSRGEADVSVGNEKSARQVDTIDFIPIKQERLDLVIPKTVPEVIYSAMQEILNSHSFKAEISGIGGYDISQTGTVIAET
jgi:putative molybdopterin biosynthesis protein